MGGLSIKGMVSGLLLLIILSAIVGYIVSFQILDIYAELGVEEDTTGQIPVIELIKHPFYLPLVLITTITTTGVAAVAAASIANRAFIGNALAIGVFSVFIGIFLVESPFSDPLYLIVLSINIGIAYLGGILCQWRAGLNAVQ